MEPVHSREEGVRLGAGGGGVGGAGTQPVNATQPTSTSAEKGCARVGGGAGTWGSHRASQHLMASQSQGHAGKERAGVTTLCGSLVTIEPSARLPNTLQLAGGDSLATRGARHTRHAPAGHTSHITPARHTLISSTPPREPSRSSTSHLTHGSGVSTGCQPHGWPSGGACVRLSARMSRQASHCSIHVTAQRIASDHMLSRRAAHEPGDEVARRGRQARLVRYTQEHSPVDDLAARGQRFVRVEGRVAHLEGAMKMGTGVFWLVAKWGGEGRLLSWLRPPTCLCPRVRVRFQPTSISNMMAPSDHQSHSMP